MGEDVITGFWYFSCTTWLMPLLLLLRPEVRRVCSPRDPGGLEPPFVMDCSSSRDVDIMLCCSRFD